MVNTKQPHSSRNVFQQQSHPSARPRPQGGVRQDKRAFLRARTASRQPASPENDMRAQAIATENIRSRNRNCLLYTSDAADDLLCVDLGGRRIIKKKKKKK